MSSLEEQCVDHKKCIEQLKEQVQNKALQCDQVSKEKGAILTGHVHTHLALYIPVHIIYTHHFVPRPLLTVAKAWYTPGDGVNLISHRNFSHNFIY